MSGRPLRVTFVVPDLAAGGAERHVATLVERLDPARFEARVVCLGQEGELFGLAAAHVPATAYGLSKRQAFHALARLTRDLRRTRTDVVVVRGYSAEAIGRLAAVLARVRRRVVWVHNHDDPEPRTGVQHWIDRALERSTDAYFGVAHRQLPYLTGELGHPAEKVRIIHNGVDLDEFGGPRPVAEGAHLRDELGLAQDAVVVGIVAGLRPVKNHELFLQAAHQVLQRVPTAHFVVAGGGELQEHLEARSVALGLSGRVTFLGYRADVAAVLQALDVVVLSSHSEAFPLSLLEAMAAGRPVVATDVGGVAEIVQEGVTGHLVPPGDADAMAARVVRLAQDPARREILGSAGRARVEAQFSLERHVEQAEGALEEVAARSSLPSGRPGPERHDPVRLTMVLDETGVGGVEMVTLWMFEVMDRAVVLPRLVCLRGEGSLAEDYRRVGVEVDALERRGRFDLRTLPRLVRVMRAHRTEAILLAHHQRASLVLGRVAALLAGARVVVIAAHGMDLVPQGQRVLPRSTVETLAGVSALVVLAPSQSRYLHDFEGVGLRRWSSTREVTIPNGIHLPSASRGDARARARELLGIDPEAVLLGVVARLSPEKNHLTLLQAVAQLAPSHPHLHLAVVGGGASEEELRQVCRDLRIEDRVTFTGLRRDVADLLPGLDVSCLTSVHEAAPISVIEAMAAGVPVVVSAVGALPDMVNHGVEGLLVPPRDPTALAAALESLLVDADLRRTMGQAARARAVRDFDIRRTTHAYERLLEELVRR